MSHAHVEDDDLSPADWHYGSQEYHPPLRYNWETHLWECGCSMFACLGRCKHAIRVRREEQVEVDERFL